MQIYRRYDLDWLRVLAFMILILYHTGMFFNYWDWHVKNNVQTHLIEYPMRFTGQWRMSLLFMISGMGVYWALGSRSAGNFAAERTKRILLPLVFGMFVIVPPQIYFERLQHGATFSYPEFYKQVFEFQPYPKGSFSWHHLWYLAYIFCYSILGLPVLLALRSPAGKRLTGKLANGASDPVLLLGIPILWHSIGELLFGDEFPTTNNLIHDWRQHFHYFTLFLTGFIFCTHQRFWDSILKHRYLTLAIGLVCTSVLYAFVWGHSLELSDRQWQLMEFLFTTNAWCWLLTIFGFGYRYLNFSNRFLSYANEAVYPFYILHQTITVSAGYYLTNVPLHWFVKFIGLALITFGGCYMLYEFFIRRFTITRLLFGLKAKEKPAASVAV